LFELLFAQITAVAFFCSGIAYHWTMQRPFFSDTSLFWAGLALYSLTAWCSGGYFHPDEHFQLLEFASMKAGITPVGELPWEYPAHIRPGLQPMLAWAVLTGFRSMGVENPFFIAFVLRWMSALWCWCLFWKAAGVFFPGQPAQARWLRCLALFLWFVPLLSVRFSSENWSQLSLLTGLMLLYQQDQTGVLSFKKALLPGFLLALAFEFRFQMAFAWPGILGWLWYRGRLQGGYTGGLVLGGVAALLLGNMADYWLYGDWYPTAWCYFQSNILEGKAATFGVSPWWFYFTDYLNRAIPPISVLLWWWFVQGVRRQPDHLWAWVMAPFLLAHLMVGHKEMRFLFPMLFPFLWYVVLGWSTLQARWTDRRWKRNLLYIPLIVNTIPLLYVYTQPVSEFIPTYRFLYHAAARQPAVLYAEKESPYVLVGLHAAFYDPPQLQVHVVPDLRQIPPGFLLEGDYLLHRSLLPPQVPYAGHLRRVHTALPDWVLRYNPNQWQNRSRLWSSYQVIMNY
jgi:GPI mannosyltransferase 3